MSTSRPGLAERCGSVGKTPVGRVLLSVACFLLWLPPHGILCGALFWLAMLGFAGTRTERRACVVHLCAALAGLVALAGGGWYSHFSGEYTQCRNNATMHRDCMWGEQTPLFGFIYVLHYMGGGWLVVAWICDGLSLPGWLWTAASRPCDGPRLFALYSPRPLWPTYTGVVCAAFAAFTLTWWCAAWSTHATAGELDLSELLLVLVLVAAAVPVAAGVALQLEARRKRAGGVANDDAEVLKTLPR